MHYDKIGPIILCYPTFFPSFPFVPPVAMALKKTTPSSAASRKGTGPVGTFFNCRRTQACASIQCGCVFVIAKALLYLGSSLPWYSSLPSSFSVLLPPLP